MTVRSAKRNLLLGLAMLAGFLLLFFLNYDPDRLPPTPVIVFINVLGLAGGFLVVMRGLFPLTSAYAIVVGARLFGVQDLRERLRDPAGSLFFEWMVADKKRVLDFLEKHRDEPGRPR